MTSCFLTAVISKSLFLRVQLNNINAILGEQKKLKCSLLLKWQNIASSNAQKQINEGLHLQGGMERSALYLACNTLVYGHVL